MKKAHLTIALILSLCGTLSFLNGCKARKVTLRTSDSVESYENTNKSHIEQTHSDKSKIFQIDLNSKTDSSETTTTIIPAEGKTITVNKDGSFSGEAKSVISHTKKAVQKKSERNKQIENNITEALKKDTSSVQKKEVAVHKKDKQTESKPAYGWIIYLVIGVIILAGAFVVYWRMRKK